MTQRFKNYFSLEYKYSIIVRVHGGGAEAGRGQTLVFACGSGRMFLKATSPPERSGFIKLNLGCWVSEGLAWVQTRLTVLCRANKHICHIISLCSTTTTTSLFVEEFLFQIFKVVAVCSVNL